VANPTEKELENIQDIWRLRLEMGDCKESVRKEMYKEFLLKKEFYRLISVVIFVAVGTVGINNYMNKEVSKEVTAKFESSITQIIAAIERKK